MQQGNKKISRYPATYRIKAATLQFLIFDQLVPFIAGVILVNILSSLVFSNIIIIAEPLSPIVPFSVNLLTKESAWTHLNNNVKNPFSKTVWIITPTYKRPYQLAEITRLAQALLLVSGSVEWLIFDEFEHSSSRSNLKRLKDLLTPYNNLSVRIEMTAQVTKGKDSRGKGVMARRTALDYLREKNLQGILYFADDDNTYDSEIFRQVNYY